MTLYLWTMAVLLLLTVAGKLIWLATGEPPARTRKTEAADAFLNGALLLWTIVILVKLP